jgi:hypothetical protein
MVKRLAVCLFLAGCGNEQNFSAKAEPSTIDTGTPATTDPTEPPAGEPVADAGVDQEVSPLQEVTLDGRESYDPGGLEITEMAWQLVGQPAGSTAAINDGGAPRPTFFADLAGDYVFELTVQNEDGVWDSTPDTVVITALPLDGFYVELSWDNTNDLDLHLLQGGAALFGAQDACFCNDNPDWGDPGQLDNPSLDADAIDGWGPETITIDEPWSGVYNVQVHYYGEDGNPTCRGACAPSVATVNIYLGGVLAASFEQLLDEQGQVWNVADIQWPSGDIHENDAVSTTNLTDCR